MATLLQEVAELLGKLPTDVVKGVIAFIQTLALAKTDEDRRRALDLAMAVAEKTIVEKEFPG